MFTRMLVLILVGAAFGCAKVKESELPGFYISSFKDIEEVLELKDDGTYYHSFIDKELGLIEDRGEWKAVGFDEDPHVELEGYSSPPFPDSPFENKRKIRENRGAVPEVSRIHSGKIRLTFDDDHRYFFKKL